MSTLPIPQGATIGDPAPQQASIPIPQGATIGDEGQKQGRTWLDSAADYASELWKQVNPVSAVQGMAQATNHPISTGSQLLQNQGELAKKAEDAFKRGDYVEGARHFINYLIPVLGQQTDAAGDLAQSGQYAKAAGMTSGIAANIAVPEFVKGMNLRVPGQAAAETLYKSALKPSTRLTLPESTQIVQTGLNEGIPVSADGVRKLNSLATDLSNKVKAQIQAGSSAGATVDAASVAQRADQLKARFANQVSPTSDLQAIDAVKQDFLNTQPAKIPVAAAQDLKSGTYNQLSAKAYGELQSATVEAQKSLARGVKEELEKQFPEIKGTNAAQSKLYDLQPELERAVARAGNHQLIGIGTAGATMAGGVLSGGPAGAAAAGLLKYVIDTPAIKSKLAIALSRASKGGLTIPAATARVVAYSNALGNALPTDSQAQPNP